MSWELAEDGLADAEASQLGIQFAVSSTSDMFSAHPAFCFINRLLTFNVLFDGR